LNLSSIVSIGITVVIFLVFVGVSYEESRREWILELLNYSWIASIGITVVTFLVFVGVSYEDS
jgi:hypothetical protein